VVTTRSQSIRARKWSVPLAQIWRTVCKVGSWEV